MTLISFDEPLIDCSRDVIAQFGGQRGRLECCLARKQER